MSIKQLDLFKFSLPKYKITKPIRLIELFAGIGAQAKSLEKLGVQFETYQVYEIDQHAIDSYNAVHGTNFQTKDITKVHASELKITERERYCYILTYSFPCQDLSLAGKRKGMEKGKNTRSGLLWEVERILDELAQEGIYIDVLLMENVPQVIGKGNIQHFQLWRKKLESLGYSNYVELLNAKNYGIPQNRNRCFMVSIHGEYHYEFPEKQKLDLRLKDMLDENVDEKYYISQKMLNGMINTKFESYKLDNKLREKESIAQTIIARFEGSPQCIKDEINVVGNTTPSNHEAGRVFDTRGVAPTIKENHGTVAKIKE